MLKNVFGLIVAASLLSACIVRTRPHGHRNEPRRMSKTCPPSQHWNGYQCVHNGRGRR